MVLISLFVEYSTGGKSWISTDGGETHYGGKKQCLLNRQDVEGELP